MVSERDGSKYSSTFDKRLEIWARHSDPEIGEKIRCVHHKTAPINTYHWKHIIKNRLLKHCFKILSKSCSVSDEKNLTKCHTTRRTQSRRMSVANNSQVSSCLVWLAIDSFYYLPRLVLCACISGIRRRVQSVVDSNKKRTAESAMLLNWCCPALTGQKCFVTDLLHNSANHWPESQEVETQLLVTDSPT